MNSYFAQVCVNIPSDKLFTYQIPQQLIKKAEVGKRVLVPFRNRRLMGHIVELIDKTTLQECKEIINILDDSPIISPPLMELFKWISDYYITSLANVIAGALPAKLGFHKQSLPIKKQKYLQLTNEGPDITKFIQAYEKKAPKQTAIISFLLKHGEVLLPRVLEATKATHQTVNSLIQKGLIEVSEKEIYRKPVLIKENTEEKKITPNYHQQKSITQIQKALDNKCFTPFLLHGITGSGKTYVYLQAVLHSLKSGKTAIVLVPEISLTHQLINRFHTLFGDRIAVIHSGLSEGERYDEWRRIHQGEAKVVIGARSAIFAPLADLGLIVLDEEHETSYKQDNAPRYHTREVALMRAKIHQAVLILGSATPSLESFHLAQEGFFKLLKIPTRATTHSLSNIQLIDLKKEFRKQKSAPLFSQALIQGIRQRLQKKEQTILFLNRRGFSSFLLCRLCGYVPKCKHCSVSLTYHSSQNILRCHYCSYVSKVLTTCPNCKGILQPIGFGTQKVEEEAGKFFPKARIQRMDQDTVTRKNSHQQILSRLGRGEIDILIGTQMIAKGLDFPKVTLVGVVAADTLLNLPDFRAAERTFQLITQVAGRSGRGEVPGEVIIQTFSPSHYSLQCACQMNYLGFYHQEILYRKELGYPPLGKMINIIIKGAEVNTLKYSVEKLMDLFIALKPDEIIILGPAQALFFKSGDYTDIKSYSNPSTCLP